MYAPPTGKKSRDIYKAKPGVDATSTKRYLEVILGPEDASPADKEFSAWPTGLVPSG